jgi:hypothetical protein
MPRRRVEDRAERIAQPVLFRLGQFADEAFGDRAEGQLTRDAGRSALLGQLEVQRAPVAGALPAGEQAAADEPVHALRHRRQREVPERGERRQ